MAVSLTTKNILANYSSRIWGFISVFLFVPIYNHILGVENYGVIAFYSVLFGLFSFIDAGISSIIIREFAKAEPDSHKIGLLKLFERIYMLICLFVSLTLILFAPYISSRWLHAVPEMISEQSGNVRLIAIALGIQLMSMIYNGALMGLQQQVKANGLQILWGFIKSAGVIVALYLLGKNLTVFFVFQIVCNLGYVIGLRWAVISIFEDNNYPAISLKNISKEIIHYISGMVVIATLSAVNTQLDKLLTSKFLSLSSFSYYFMCSTLAQIPVLIATAIAAAVFPIFARYFSEGNTSGLQALYRRYYFAVSCLVLPIVVVLTLFGNDLFHLWLQRKHALVDGSIANKLSITITGLSVGNAFLALQFIPFYLLLSTGKTKFTIMQSITQLVLLFPALYLLIRSCGMNGAALSWMLMNLFGLIFITIVVHKTVLKKGYLNIITWTLLCPAGINILFGIFSKLLLKDVTGYYVIPVSIALFVLLVFLNLLVFNKYNPDVSVQIRKFI